jgi:hypothetical protein
MIPLLYAYNMIKIVENNTQNMSKNDKKPKTHLEKGNKRLFLKH